MSNKLSLRIHRVACIDETNGKYVEKIGNDEIYLGGYAVNEKGETVEIAPISIYPHFDDGDVKVFNPAKIFYTFPLPASGEWPKGFGIGLVLMERDSGRDLTKAVNQITAFAKQKIAEEFAKEKKKREEKKKGLEAAVVLTPIVIMALKYAAPYIIDYVGKKLISALNDDVFTPQLATIEIPSANFTWSGSKDSVEKIVSFRDHGGHYALTYDWLLN